MYLHPEGIDAHLLATWAALGPRLLPYFDIPLQHVSPRILKSMGRGGGRAEIDALLERIRRACPAAVLRTSLIAGYPGEEEADFRELLDWVEAGAVEHLGVFAYSDLPEAASHRLSGHLPEELKEQRREELYRAHEPHIARRNAAMLGRRAEVLIDALRSVRGRTRQYEGRVWWQAYGIDGVVHVAAEHRLKPGARLAVRISGAGGCDLHAEPEAGSGQF
jgi:tRNA A37 methylthiotransferase MiaB